MSKQNNNKKKKSHRNELSDRLMNDTAGWFHQSLFGLLHRIHLKTLPHANGFISGNSCHGGAIWTQGQTENSVLVA